MNNARLQEAVDTYLASLEAQGLARNTLKSHRQTLDHLVLECGNVFTRTLTTAHTDRLFSAHSEWASATRNLHLTNVRAFYAYCRVRGWMAKDADPTVGWRPQKVVRVERQRIPVEHFPTVLDAAPHPRDRALIALGLFAFLRGGECRALRVKDVDLDNFELRVYREKTREWDVLPISLELSQEMVRWLDWYRHKQGPLDPEWYLIPARKPNPMVNDGHGNLVPADGVAGLRPTTRLGHAYRMVQVTLDRCGYTVEGEGGHTLRRSGARALFDQLRSEGYDGALQRVRAMLGHKSAEMTERYLGISVERQQRNTLLAGKVMFPALQAPSATVINFQQEVRHG